MRYPLLWKELRENRIALLIGIPWVLGSIGFWLSWADVATPWYVNFVLAPAAMFAPGACMLFLGVARFAAERHNGTWEFLRAQPVALRRLVAAKFGVSVGIAVVFISLSSGSAWYPIVQLEPRLAHMTLPHWVCFHAAAAALFVSLLLLLDTLDWGDWLGLRALVSPWRL